jgi:hypothetical protein
VSRNSTRAGRQAPGLLDDTPAPRTGVNVATLVDIQRLLGESQLECGARSESPAFCSVSVQPILRQGERSRAIESVWSRKGAEDGFCPRVPVFLGRSQPENHTASRAQQPSLFFYDQTALRIPTIPGPGEAIMGRLAPRGTRRCWRIQFEHCACSARTAAVRRAVKHSTSAEQQTACRQTRIGPVERIQNSFRVRFARDGGRRSFIYRSEIVSSSPCRHPKEIWSPALVRLLAALRHQSREAGN